MDDFVTDVIDAVVDYAADGGFGRLGRRVRRSRPGRLVEGGLRRVAAKRAARKKKGELNERRVDG